MTAYSYTSCWYWVRQLSAAMLLVFSTLCFAQSSNEKIFASPGDAVLALYNAAKSNDTSAMNLIFGSNAPKILNTGDAIADKNAIATFVRRYDQMHRVVLEPNGTVTLYVGADNWPLPITLVKDSSGKWYFDTDAGMKEILYRRVGTNENDAIDTLHTLVEAQREYAAQTHDGSETKQYALRFVSTAGKQDGLYWRTDDNQAPSPIGPLIADASSQGYTAEQGKVTPFHGYYFRILTKQGPAAKGGPRDYVANGQLSKGFAFVAYPSDYRNTGVMTFVVNQDGIVYQKDCGPATDKIGAGMTEYNPDSSWSPAD